MVCHLFRVKLVPDDEELIQVMVCHLFRVKLVPDDDLLVGPSASNQCNHTLRTTKLLGGILVSLHLSVRPSVRPATRVRSVAPTVLVGSISYLHILSNNFRRCGVCKVPCKISKLELFVTFTLSCSDLRYDVNHQYGWSWGGGGYFRTQAF